LDNRAHRFCRIRTSLAVDADGNLHVSYYYPVEGQLKYGFRPAKSARWFTMGLDKGFGEFSTRITVDPKGNPHICYSPNILKYASFDGRRWTVQQIDPGGGLVSYFCSLRIGPDGAPQVSWYVESGTYIRYAALKNGAWIAQTADAENKPGKWNSMVLDNTAPHFLSEEPIVKDHGIPFSRFILGICRCAIHAPFSVQHIEYRCHSRRTSLPAARHLGRCVASKNTRPSRRQGQSAGRSSGDHQKRHI